MNEQETLEEMAYRELGIKEGQWHPNIDKVPYFIKGYKLAQEQNKNLYSEEEVIDLIQFLSMNEEFNGYSSVTRETAKHFFDQFKKK